MGTKDNPLPVTITRRTPGVWEDPPQRRVTFPMRDLLGNCSSLSRRLGRGSLRTSPLRGPRGRKWLREPCPEFRRGSEDAELSGGGGGASGRRRRGIGRLPAGPRRAEARETGSTKAEVGARASRAGRGSSSRADRPPPSAPAGSGWLRLVHGGDEPDLDSSNPPSPVRFILCASRPDGRRWSPCPIST